MTVKFSTPTNRLAAYVGWKGISRADAVSQAHSNVETLRRPTIEYIDQNLSFIIGNVESIDGTTINIRALYEASNAIAATAGLFGLDVLGRGAFSLCELLSRLEERNSWNADAVRVHVNSLKVLRQFGSASGTADGQIVLDNLAKLLTHVAS